MFPMYFPAKSFFFLCFFLTTPKNIPNEKYLFQELKTSRHKAFSHFVRRSTPAGSNGLPSGTQQLYQLCTMCGAAPGLPWNERRGGGGKPRDMAGLQKCLKTKMWFDRFVCFLTCLLVFLCFWFIFWVWGWERGEHLSWGPKGYQTIMEWGWIAGLWTCSLKDGSCDLGSILLNVFVVCFVWLMKTQDIITAKAIARESTPNTLGKIPELLEAATTPRQEVSNIVEKRTAPPLWRWVEKIRFLSPKHILWSILFLFVCGFGFRRLAFKMIEETEGFQSCLTSPVRTHPNSLDLGSRRGVRQLRERERVGELLHGGKDLFKKGLATQMFDVFDITRPPESDKFDVFYNVLHVFVLGILNNSTWFEFLISPLQLGTAQHHPL